MKRNRYERRALRLNPEFERLLAGATVRQSRRLCTAFFLGYSAAMSTVSSPEKRARLTRPVRLRHHPKTVH